MTLAALATRRAAPRPGGLRRLPREHRRARGCAAFHKRFYRVRAAWAERDPAGWLARMAPYPGLCDAAAPPRRRRAPRDRHREGPPLGASRSSRPTASPTSSRTASCSTRRPARRSARTWSSSPRSAGCAPAEITFVDDKVNHLEDVAALGCALRARRLGLQRRARARDRPRPRLPGLRARRLRGARLRAVVTCGSVRLQPLPSGAWTSTSACTPSAPRTRRASSGCCRRRSCRPARPRTSRRPSAPTSRRSQPGCSRSTASSRSSWPRTS